MMRELLTLLPVVTFALLLWHSRARPSRATRLVVRGALVLLAFASAAAACGSALREAVRAPYGKPDAWGLFHYYLGAKYFPELDYQSFYACALAADRDGARRWDAETKVRDLSSYAIVARDGVAPCPRARFSPGRWQAFTRDVAALQALLPDAQRPHVLTDKGFNPPPSWATPAGWLANRLPLERVAVVTVAFNLDLVFALLSLLAIALALDVGTGALAGIFLFLYFGSFGRLTGTFLQYAWLPALTGAFLAWRVGRYRQSAVWWAAATLLQTFPLALTGGVGLRWLWLLARRRHDRSAWRASSTFVGHYAMWLAVGVAASATAPHGVEAWRRWIDKIGAHGRYLIGEVFDIGLRNLVATATSPGVAGAVSYAQDAPNVAARLAGFAEWEWVWYVAAIAVLAYVLWRMASVTSAGVVALGYVTMYVFLDLSPYYYASLTLLFVLFPLAEGRAALIVHGGLLGLLAYHAAEMPTGYITFSWSDHVVSEALIASFMAALLLVATRPDPVARAGDARGARAVAGVSRASPPPRGGSST